MKREEGIAKRCTRCAGSGDIPIISPDCFVHPDRPPLLKCCPNCNGTGFAVDEVEAEQESA